MFELSLKASLHKALPHFFFLSFNMNHSAAPQLYTHTHTLVSSRARNRCPACTFFGLAELQCHVLFSSRSTATQTSSPPRQLLLKLGSAAAADTKRSPRNWFVFLLKQRCFQEVASHSKPSAPLSLSASPPPGKVVSCFVSVQGHVLPESPTTLLRSGPQCCFKKKTT